MENKEPGKQVLLDKFKQQEMDRVASVIQRLQGHEITEKGSIEERLKNDSLKDSQQKRSLRVAVLVGVFVTLMSVIVLLAAVVLLQGFGEIYHFHLNDWVIGILVNGALAHVLYIVTKIVDNLFPGNAEKKSMLPWGKSSK